MTKKEKGLLVGVFMLLAAGLVAFGETLGAYDLSTFWEFVGWQPNDVMLTGAIGPLGYLVSRIGMDAMRTNKSRTEAFTQAQTALKVGAEAQTQAKLDAMTKAVEENTRVTKLQIENDRIKQEALAQLDIAPDAIKNLDLKKL